MTRALAALALALAAGACGNGKTAPPQPKSEVYLITTLPLLFGEDFGLAFRKPPMTDALEKRFLLLSVDLPSQVPAGATLLMAQPRALPAEELIALDAWVRAGGKLVLLADPRLEWPSRRPLGDKLRPPPMFADTGLLAHWGLRLDAPEGSSVVKSGDDVGPIIYLSPGTLVRTGGFCIVETDRVVATCELGKGEAIIVADADWLDMPRVDAIAGKHIRADERLIGVLSGIPPVI